jgi:hypothetical protein
MSNEPIDPTSSARAFYAVQLRRMRTAAKMTQADAGGHPDMMVSGKLIGAVENCYRPPTLRLPKGLDKAFGLVQFYEGTYASIKRESGIPSDFWEYTEQETLASSIKIYENFLITGLLQTEEYAREIVRAGLRADKLNERLLDVVHEPNITVRIVPDGVPVYPTAPFTVLGFHNEPDVGYVVGENGLGRVIQPGSQVSELGVLFDRIGSVALPIADSEKLIRTALEDV